MVKKQGGFTLVEIAIVLVIVGLLLAGVLKGQEMIENGRVKSGVSDLNGVAAAYNSYLDRYKTLPGDDGPTAAINARGGNFVAPMVGNAAPNGVILAAAATTFAPAAGAENELFFRHLRAAGYLSGDANAALINALPLNAWGGRTGVVNVVTQGRPAARLQVCMGNVPGKAAAAMDVQLDDGIIGTGDVRSTVGPNNIAPAAAATPAAYNEGLFYTVCRNI